ncbi:MAG: hypothetical protein ABR548_04940 [Actinomycetota bacterium]
MARIEINAETALSPEKVTSMLTDFSDRRPDIWPGLFRDAYEVYSVGDTWAEVKEGNKKPKVWARERYDWSKPGIVRWEVVESNFSKPGSFLEAHISPREGGGSRVRVVRSRSPSSVIGYIALGVIILTRGAPVKASMMAAFKKAEKEAV